MSSRFTRAVRTVNDAVESAMATGKYRGESWRQTPVADHVANARRHLDAVEWTDRTKPHLIHAATRALMALEVQLEEKKKSATSAR